MPQRRRMRNGWRFRTGLSQRVVSEMRVYRRGIDTRWVLTWKQAPDGTPFAKARLVARGFQDLDPGTKKAMIAASVARKGSPLLIISTAALRSCHLPRLGTAAAFSKSGCFDRDVFVKAPSVAGDPHFWKLSGAVYGLNAAPFLVRPYNAI